MSWVNPVTVPWPGTSTGWNVIVNWFPIVTFAASTWPEKLFVLFMFAVHGV